MSIFVMLDKLQFSSVAQLCLTLWDPMDCSMPSFPWINLEPGNVSWNAPSLMDLLFAILRGALCKKDSGVSSSFSRKLCAARLVMSSTSTAPHSSTLAWRIPWVEEPGGLQSMESLRVGHDWATSFSHFTFMHWRRKWMKHSSVLAWRIPGMGSLVGCRLRGRTESDTTEAT